MDTTRKKFGQASETKDQVAATVTSVNAPSSARRLVSGVEIQVHGRPLAKQKTVSPTFIYIFLVQKGESIVYSGLCVGVDKPENWRNVA